MAKTVRSTGLKAAGRDLRALLTVPQHDLQAQLASRLERVGFPSLRAGHGQLLSAIAGLLREAGLESTDQGGVRLADLVTVLAVAKQTVGDLLDELEAMKVVERFPDPDHGVIKRVRLGPKGKVWAAEVKKVSAAAEAKWATRLGSKKMRSLRALLEELAATVEGPATRVNGQRRSGSGRR